MNSNVIDFLAERLKRVATPPERFHRWDEPDDRGRLFNFYSRLVATPQPTDAWSNERD
jgi:hypothetical protein